VIAIHGVADQNVPFAGGVNTKGFVRVDHGSVAASLGRWRAIDRCEASRTVRAGPLLTEIANCAGGTDVMLVAVDGAGHQWPGAKLAPPEAARLLGLDPPSTALDATGALWLFFQPHTASSPGPNAGR
jgi:polyhydroxybutyrate depolymerase